MDKATRVEAGVAYCSTCYARSFKRLLCGGCRMFKKLLASAQNPRCRACVIAQPCVRCKRTGRAIGMLTAYGPVCNACRTHFLEPKPCEECGQLSSRLTRVGDGDKKLCPRCARADHKTCNDCHRHRSCAQGGDGRWRCGLCTRLGQVTCAGCSESMPAGRGKRCEQCESKERFARNASQLAELITGARARLAFGQYTDWLSGEAALKATVRRLPEHVQFFEALDKAGDEPWTGEFLLRHFGTAQLRRFELPVRWLEQQRGVVFSAESKQTEAETRRAAVAVDGVPEGTLARTLIDEFSSALGRRVASGDLSPRSMRMALRPAIGLLANEDPTGGRVPGQKALDRYLQNVPGQRAAISTFLGFLKADRGVELKLSAKPAPGAATVRKQLEKQIVALVTKPGEATRLTERWLPLGLRYFHHLSAAQAKSICGAAEVRYDQDGVHLLFEGQTYWLPARPTIHGGLVGRVGT